MSTIDERWNIVDTTRAFCQKVLPLVYDESLSYMEMVCKMSSKLNEVIENNNNLPQYVKELIKETVNSDDFRQIVGSVLMDTIINVKFPPEGITPAKGDGITDDTNTIQACFDYANNQGGAVVFFPSGKYLTGTLSINAETSVLGADRYNTSLVLKGGGNTPLLQGAINQSVRNISLDGNRLNQVEENYLIDGTIDMALFDNVILCDSAHCITADACNNTEFCNVLCKDIGDDVFITAAGNNNLLTNINTEYAINLTGNNNSWQSQQQTKIDSVEPLKYGTPFKLSNKYNAVKATDLTGNNYNILIEGDSLLPDTIINVKEHGVVGDGVTNDTAAIQKLINENKALFFPCGTYIIDTLQLKPEVSLIGESQYCTVFEHSATNDLLYTPNYANYENTITSDLNDAVYNVVIKNIHFKGNDNDKNGIGYYGFSLNMENVIISNFGGKGIVVYSPGDIHSTEEYSLQNIFSKLRVFYNRDGNIYYNGQSDSLFDNILSYYGPELLSSELKNFQIGTKAPGCKFNNMHIWGNSDYSLYVLASGCTFTNTHVEGGNTQVFLRSGNTSFIGEIYDTLHNNQAVGIEMGQYVANTFIQASFRDLGTCIKYGTYRPSSLTMFINATLQSGSNLCDVFPSKVFMYGTLNIGGNITPIFTNAYFSFGSYTDNILRINTENRDLLFNTGDGQVRIGKYTGGTAPDPTGYLELKDGSGRVVQLPCKILT